MNLLEKYCRDVMPQISTKDLDKVTKVLEDHDISFSTPTLKVSELKDLQTEVKNEKVNGIASEIEENGLDSMPAMITAEDDTVIDGHHRKYGIIKAEGKETEVKLLRLNYSAEEARLILKGLEDKLSERLRTTIGLMALATINGQLAEHILVGKGYGRKAISEAKKLGLLVPDKFGYLCTIPPHLREGKLREFAPFVAAAAGRSLAGKTVGNVLSKGTDKKKKLIQTTDDEGNPKVVDPETGEMMDLEVEK